MGEQSPHKPRGIPADDERTRGVSIMRVMTTAINFDADGNVVSIDRGVNCPKLDCRVLTQCRINWLVWGVHQHDTTGQYVVCYRCYNDHSIVDILRQYRGAYINNQQYYDFEDIGHGNVIC